jgi:uncharacterized membrane protein
MTLEGFVVGKNQDYAAIPYANKGYIIIHDGQQLQVCKTESSARKFIDAHKRGKSVAKLPVE